MVANALKVQWWLRRAVALDLGGTVLGKGIHVNEGAAMVEICYFGGFGLLPHWIWMELCWGRVFEFMEVLTWWKCVF